MSGPRIFDRVKDSSTTTGTGDFTLSGTAPSGYQAFGAVLSDSDTCPYCIADQSGTNWEVGVGTYKTSGPKLQRTTVLAGSNGTSAVNFGVGTKDVFLTLPADFANQFLHPTAAYASLAAFQAGRLLLPSDGFALLRDTGSALAPWGPIYPLTDPTAAGLSTWDNQGSATVSTAGGVVTLQCASNGSANGAHVRYKTAPSTPYTITALILMQGSQASGFGLSEAGILFRDSATGKLSTWGQWSFSANNYLANARYNTAGSYNATNNYYTTFQWFNPVWLRIADDGVNRKYSVSPDGRTWTQVFSEGRTVFHTADQVGFYLDPYSSDMTATLLSWKEGP
jgi:hypothetical protein